MKRWTLTFTIIFLSISAWSQCPTEDIVMHTQQDIDNFAVNYPGCTEMLNNISIGVGWAATITSLNGLSQLTSISGQLRIDNTDLVNLMGLENLQSIGGLEMRNNYNLATLTGLENLTSINNLRILKSDLASLAGLENLTAINGNLEIEQNGDLISLTGLDNITSVSGDLRIITNKSLPNMVGLEGLTSVGGWFSITGVNPFLGNASPSQVDLTSIAELENLTSVGGLLISGTTALTNLTGLENLSTIGGFSIERNDILNDLTALGNITTLGGYLRITDNDVLTDLTIFENLTAIDGFLWLEDNAILTDLMVFENLITIDGELKIDNNAAISSLMGLENIDHTTITELKITSNPNLALCDLLNICTYLENGGTVDIRNNSFGCANQLDIEQACMDMPPSDCPPGDVTLNTQAQVDAFAANFPNCTTINGNLNIQEDVIDLSGLSSLMSITGNLFIHFTQSLTSLAGLEQIDSIGGSLQFDALWSDVTLDISALDHPIEIGVGIFIGDIYPNAITPCTIQPICDVYNENPNNVVSTYDVCLPELQTTCGATTQDCPEGDVSIYCQGQMDAFVAQYPNCTEINGNFRLYGDNIDEWYNFGCPINVNLPNLTRINGTLGLGTHVSGLGNLKYVGGISVSPTGIAALTSLDTVAGDVRATSDVDDPYYSVSFPSCPQLKYIGGDLRISTYYGSFNSNRFPELEYVGGDISFSPGWTNINTANLSEMNNLRYVGGNISLGDGNISGFNALDTIGGYLNFGSAYYDPPVSVNITGLNQLKYIGGHFTLEDRLFGPTCVMDLSGLQELNYIGGDFQYIGQSAGSIDGCNSALDSINGMDKLKYVGGSLRIINNDLLHLDFLNQLETVGGDLELTNNDLGNIEGLNNMVDVSGEVIITQNSALSQCAVQAVCDHITDGNPTMIANNLSGCNSESEVETACQLLFPVEMAAPLRVYLNDKTAILQWRTATETNNKGFEIQRSKDGIEWERIAWQAGQGNTSTPQTYSYIDQNPIFGTSYYRLKQVDFDGDAEYSNVVSLRYIRNGVTVYPNPVKAQLNLHTNYGTIQQIVIYDSNGKRITQIARPDNNIDVSILSEGIYMIKITIDDEDFYKKIIVE